MFDVCAFFGFSGALLLGQVCEVEEGLVSVDGWVVGCSLVGEGYGWERRKDGFGEWFGRRLLVGFFSRKEREEDERKVYFDAGFVCGSPRVVCPAVFDGFCEFSEGTPGLGGVDVRVERAFEGTFGDAEETGFFGGG